MWNINKGTALLIVLGFFAVGVGMIYYSFQVSPTELTEDGYPLKDFLLYGGIGYIILILVILGVVTLYYTWINAREKNLRENGLRGQARILSAQQTGRFVNNLPQVKLLLEITSPTGEIYQIEHKEVVSMLAIGSLGAGAVLPVYIDPNNKKKIVLDY